jgi:hypothetical protein
MTYGRSEPKRRGGEVAGPFNVFRRKRAPGLCCAVPEHQPVPRFLSPDDWEYAAKVTGVRDAPSGFRFHAAYAGVRFNGFYVFQSN